MTEILHNPTIRQLALEVGFDACGLSEAGFLPSFSRRLSDWINDGGHAQMRYMEQLRDIRSDPRLLLPEAKTVISVLLGYKPSARMKGKALIAQYAYGQDYHEVLKERLYILIGRIKELYPEFEGRPFVDTAPISDRSWALKSGLGWQGKNGLLINPELGSYCFLGEIVTTLSADSYDQAIEDRCSDCRRCVEACPNKAIMPFEEGFRLMASRCTAYHTIENRDPELPETLRLAGYAYGCDICQLACPHNLYTESKIEISAERIEELERLQETDEKSFRRFVKHSAMSRIKYSQWQRNLAKLKNDTTTNNTDL